MCTSELARRLAATAVVSTRCNQVGTSLQRLHLSRGVNLFKLTDTFLHEIHQPPSVCRLKAAEQARQTSQEEASAHASLLATLRNQFKAYQAGKAKEVSILAV